MDRDTDDAECGAGAANDAIAPVAIVGGLRRDPTGRFLPRGSAAKPAARSTARRRSTAGTKRAKPRRPVPWSARREAIFLETLAETSCIAASIRASGFSETNVYQRRRKSAEFRAKWAEALREGYARLQGILLDRAVNGVETPVFFGGKKIGSKREFNDRTALSLLALHRDAVMGVPTASEEPVEQMRAQLKAKLSEMNKRMGGAG